LKLNYTETSIMHYAKIKLYMKYQVENWSWKN